MILRPLTNESQSRLIVVESESKVRMGACKMPISGKVTLP